MYPSKRKYKTKVQHVDSPRFNECFKVSRIPPEDVEQMGCRIRSDKRYMFLELTEDSTNIMNTKTHFSDYMGSEKFVID